MCRDSTHRERMLTMFRFKTFIALISVLALTFLFAGCKDGDADNNIIDEVSKIFEKDDTSEPEEDNDERYTFDHITIELPEGFTMRELSGVPIAVCPGYPDPSDNITFTQTGADNINNYNKSVFEEAYKQTFEGFKEITSYEVIKVDGVDSIRMMYVISMNGMDMTQTQVFIFGKTFTDIVSFTSVSGNFDKEFEDCLASVKVK